MAQKVITCCLSVCAGKSCEMMNVINDNLSVLLMLSLTGLLSSHCDMFPSYDITPTDGET